MTEAYPLHWPVHRKRSARRERARFDTTQHIAQLALLSEIKRLGGANVVISTNLKLRNDGLPYASRRAPDDPGVAVYFSYKNRPVCFACDRWDRIQDNMQAIRKTIDALRGISRWGTGDMMEAAFAGFEALAAPGQQATRPWRDVLNANRPDMTIRDVEIKYRTLAKERHPDMGGSNEQMAELNAAFEQAKLELGE